MGVQFLIGSMAVGPVQRRLVEKVARSCGSASWQRSRTLCEAFGPEPNSEVSCAGQAPSKANRERALPSNGLRWLLWLGRWAGRQEVAGHEPVTSGSASPGWTAQTWRAASFLRQMARSWATRASGQLRSEPRGEGGSFSTLAKRETRRWRRATPSQEDTHSAHRASLGPNLLDSWFRPVKELAYTPAAEDKVSQPGSKASETEGRGQDAEALSLSILCIKWHVNAMT